MEKKPRGRPKQPKVIELDPAKDYIILIPTGIPEEQVRHFVERYSDKQNVLFIASNDVTVVRIK